MKIKQDVRSVYVILNKDTKRVKIGFSNNPETRRKTLENHSGSRMTIIYQSKYVYNYAEVERDMHNLYLDKRYFGEWFIVDAFHVAKRLKSLVVNSKSCIIIKHFNNNKNPTQIASILGVSRSGIVKYLTEKGILISYKSIQGKKVYDKEINIDTKKGVNKLTLEQMVIANNEKIREKKERRKEPEQDNIYEQ